MSRVIEIDFVRRGRVLPTPHSQVVVCATKKSAHSAIEVVRRFRDNGVPIGALAVTHPQKRKGVEKDLRNALLGRLHVPMLMLVPVKMAA